MTLLFENMILQSAWYTFSSWGVDPTAGAPESLSIPRNKEKNQDLASPKRNESKASLKLIFWNPTTLYVK